MTYESVKPLFAYIGGKSWLKNKLQSTTIQITNNHSFDSYLEPFCGELGAFLGIYDILHQKGIRNIYLNDINRGIINTYLHIQNNPSELLFYYQKIENIFKEFIPEEALHLHGVKHKKELKLLLSGANLFFKDIRSNYNNTNRETPQDCAMLLFLQTHCYNGVYRENLKGEYNTPFNWKASLKENSLIEKRIISLHQVFSLFNLHLLNLNNSDLPYPDNCLLYLDPPYINQTGIENKYNTHPFNLKEQIELIESLYGQYFIYSNHEHQDIIDAFKKIPNITIEQVYRKNIISSNNNSRQKDKTELFIYNSNF